MVQFFIRTILSQKFPPKSLFKVESAGKWKKMGSKIKDNSQNDQKSILDSIRWWLGLSWWFSVKGKWSTVVHSSYHCCENDSHSRQSCWCITLQSISPPPLLHCMIDERQGKSNISQKELSRLRTWMILRWWHICFAHSAKGISVKLNAELTKKQMMTKTCLVTNVFTFLTADRIASICHQIEHLSPHSTVVTTVEIYCKRVSYTKSRTFFLSLTTFFLRDNFLRTRCQRTAKSKGQTEEKATEATSSSSHQPTLLLYRLLFWLFYACLWQDRFTPNFWLVAC